MQARSSWRLQHSLSRLSQRIPSQGRTRCLSEIVDYLTRPSMHALRALNAAVVKHLSHGDISVQLVVSWRGLVLYVPNIHGRRIHLTLVLEKPADRVSYIRATVYRYFESHPVA